MVIKNKRWRQEKSMLEEQSVRKQTSLFED